ncbi:hypothetical protein BpOF4_12155 [Alkalihalophilus pseudofirmus OF4]|uniref:Sigma factor regulator C-terminal domain-containing protein n=1 Tax=Alkalihalophilus pseudofirmus (strain ATCC BAA-2126 / JCM 17055 / OF4) TaxID=398511 RepID=D3FWI6_ALKPO|nr:MULTISPECIES: anti sigma factor C-terminal domain-containing protein [Alkalihalophilus]ADC50484.1 hypothetical protein BpOF4_12155 [Alkalihalophilus pseudofirmus OF4]MED1603225.1 anti sigma factor C-terminal domain-containing protein [Alkalihalophilus marmarensis]
MTDKKLFSSGNEGLGQLVKKARRKSMIKTVIISIIASMVVLFSLYWLGSHVLQRAIDQSGDNALWSMVSDANVEGKGASYTYSLFSAIETRDREKYIDGVSLNWGAEETEYTMFGTKKPLSSVTSTSITHQEGERPISYFQGERVIEFFHPEVNYKEVYDDRPLLENIPEYMVAEMAFSFDQAYPLEEVIDVFGDQLEWYWIDTYTDEEITDFNEMNSVREEEGVVFDHLHTLMGSWVRGYPYAGLSAEDSAQSFIHTIEYLQEETNEFEYEINQMINGITNDGEKEFVPENIEIIGVVVTGRADELSQFNGVDFIRGATLGATAKKFD